MKPTQSVFLERRGYRLRRVMDAARLLPLIGLVVMLLPVFMGVGSSRNLAVFIFVVWVVLICLAGILGRVLGAELAPPSENQSES